MFYLYTMFRIMPILNAWIFLLMYLRFPEMSDLNTHIYFNCI